MNSKKSHHRHKQSINKYYGPLLIVLGLIYGLGFSKPLLWPLCIPYILLLGYMWVEKPEYRRLRLWTWLSGLALMMVVARWIADVNPSSWDLPGNFELGVFIIIVWLFSALVWSLGFVALPHIYLLLRRLSSETMSRYGLFSVAFIVCEWLRSVLFSVANSGKGSSIGAFWSFGSFGLSFSKTPLIYTSRIVGLFGMSLLSLILVYGLFCFVRKVDRKLSGLLIAVVVIVTVLGLAWPQNNRPFEHTVTVVHKPYTVGITRVLEQSLPEDYKAPEVKSQLVVLSEYSRIFGEYESTQRSLFASRLAGNSPSIFVDAGSYLTKDKHYNRIGLFEADGTMVDSQLKKLLIPEGEYIPYYTEWLIRLSGNGSVIPAFESARVDKFDQPTKTFSYGDERLGALACSSVIAPDAYREQTKNGATILINSADLGVFHNSKSYYSQNIQLAKFEAVANSRPYVQVAKQGISTVIDHNGKIIDYLEDTEGLQVRSYDLTTNTTKTPYTVLGEWVLYASIAVTLASGGYFYGNRKVKKT